MRARVPRLVPVRVPVAALVQTRSLNLNLNLTQYRITEALEKPAKAVMNAVIKITMMTQGSLYRFTEWALSSRD